MARLMCIYEANIDSDLLAGHGEQDGHFRDTIDDGFNLSHHHNELKDRESVEWLTSAGYSGGLGDSQWSQSGQLNRNALAQGPRSAAKTKPSKCLYSHLSSCYACVTSVGLRGD
jgi:hypothetical protein